MGNKIITEEDFWECTGGLVPVPLQSSQRLVYTNGRKAKKYITLADKSTVSWVDFGCKKLMLLYAVIAAAIAALCAATGGAALIAICALAGAAGAMWGAVVGSLLCGQLAAMARVWCSSKDDFQILGINTITGKDTMQCLAFTFIGQNPETITYKPGVKSWSQALATGAANLIGGLFEGMMYGACIGSAFAAGAALAGGASAGGGLAGMGRVALNFIKSIPRNILTNIAESYSAMGMGMRGVMSAQSALTTYGELGDEMTREDLNNAISEGFLSMEKGTYDSGKNILTGNGKMEDYMGIALNLTPTGQGAREVFPHNSNYQKMGIVPDNLAGKMDLDGGVKKAPDADGGVKKSVSDDGLPVKKQGSSKSRKPKGKNGKAYEKKARYGERRISDELYAELREQTPSQDIRNMVNEGISLPMPDPVLPGLEITKRLHADHIVSMDKITRMEGFDTLTREQQLSVLNNPDNFVGLSESANCSKGKKSNADWTEHKSKGIKVDPDYRESMIKREAKLEGELQQQIDDFNRQNVDSKE